VKLLPFSKFGLCLRYATFAQPVFSEVTQRKAQEQLRRRRYRSSRVLRTTEAAKPLLFCEPDTSVSGLVGYGLLLLRDENLQIMLA
jgi:hypothetical protein